MKRRRTYHVAKNQLPFNIIDLKEKDETFGIYQEFDPYLVVSELCGAVLAPNPEIMSRTFTLWNTRFQNHLMVTNVFIVNNQKIMGRQKSIEAYRNSHGKFQGNLNIRKWIF